MLFSLFPVHHYTMPLEYTYPPYQPYTVHVLDSGFITRSIEAAAAKYGRYYTDKRVNVKPKFSRYPHTLPNYATGTGKYPHR